MSGLIYDEKAYGRISSLLDQQEEDFKSIDKSSENQTKTIIRIGIIVGVSALIILGFKALIKKNN